MGPGFLQDPWSRYDQLRDAGPVFAISTPMGVRAWLITGWDEARAALTDPRLAKDPDRLTAAMNAGRDGPPAFDPSMTRHMLNSDPPDHTRLRRLVGKAFTGRRIELLRPRVQELTDRLLDAMEPAGHAELIEELAAPLPIAVISELLGVPDGDRADFRAWTTALVNSGGDQKVIGEASANMAGYLGGLLRGKRGGGSDDLLTALVAARDEDDALSDHELLSMAFLLLVAGHETTVNLIGNGVLALLRHPDQLARLRADESLLPGAIEELLRFDGPAHTTTMRCAAEALTVGGVDIAEGELVMIGIGAANRDAEHFADADQVRVDREPTHLAFGHGIHFCLGAPLARLEGVVAIGTLLRRFPGLRPAAPAESLRWRPSTLLRGLVELPVAW
jgi:cytochrome P450